MKRLQVVLCLLLFAATALGQSDRGSITGTISDITGAVVPGATVEARNLGTGNVYQAGSSETGNYTLVQLPVGTYEFAVTLPGFKRYVRPGILVQVAQVVRIDATLEVGAAAETVTVG
jgi:hypothetical protein